MIHGALGGLVSDDLYVRLGATSNVRAIRRSLLGSEEVCQAKQALSNGEITESSFRKFVRGLLVEFRSGELFPYDLTLAAIAVVLEPRMTPYSKEYLNSLARLDAAELPIATRVAKECLRAQRSASGSDLKDVWIRNGGVSTDWDQIPKLVPVRVGQTLEDIDFPTTPQLADAMICHS